MIQTDEVFPSYLAKQAEIEAAWEITEGRLFSLQAPLDALAARFFSSVTQGPEPARATHRGYFSSAVAPPLLYLPLWLCDGLSAAGLRLPSSALPQLLSATMQGYFFVRVQDDWLDDPGRADPELALFGNACLSGMIVGFTALLGDRSEPFFRAFDRAFLEFSRLTLAEQRVVRSDAPYPASLFAEHAGKVAFARVPLLAVAALADRLDLEEPATTLVQQLGVAYGLTNDALGWPRDLRAGHRTFLLAEAGLTHAELRDVQALPPGPGRDAALFAIAERLRTNLYEGGLLRRFVREAIFAHESALTTSERALPLRGFDAFTRERLAWLGALDRQIVAFALRRALVGRV